MFVDRNELIDQDQNSLEERNNNHSNVLQGLSQSNVKTNIILLVAILGAAIVGISLVLKTLSNGSSSAARAYETARDLMLQDMEAKFYDIGFRLAEADNHVSNDATISIESVKETSLLEVLEVSDVEFIAVDEEENEEGITAVLEVPGTGVYTVNLEAAEYVVDATRHYILVRVPEPELTECSINYSEVKKLKFKNNMFNDSVGVGEDLARNMLNNAYLLIKKEFESNSRYYSSAKDSAENLIESMIKELNPNIDDLVVDVVFV